MRILLKNGKVYDGTEAEPSVQDILIADDRIEKIAPAIDSPADRNPAFPSSAAAFQLRLLKEGVIWNAWILFIRLTWRF